MSRKVCHLNLFQNYNILQRAIEGVRPEPVQPPRRVSHGHPLGGRDLHAGAGRRDHHVVPARRAEAAR